MSDNYGFDFNNDGKVSFEESHLTYHIERETARSNSLSDSIRKSTVSDDIRRMRESEKDTGDNSDDTGSKKTSDDKKNVVFGFFLLFFMVLGLIYGIYMISVFIGGAMKYF
ncbi:MAG: hypothetical protein K5876_08400 [Ruminiclostridium sp.]|nr:hypothetical protein [Ruminiclostridium sp.]